ncbi:MAG: M12 family metallo-peptidase [Flavobacterium sp.]|uniref:reprolysin-like metallopeptidase n=1 Tax=Flavobacterium sp. TaxID=239 RepID=UPI0022CBC76B|nr:zinc-dependent metalloprotease family protein [Flavobacterium sp.]MCZ8197591.1 M12 family metallo-peptidase [Flavobacterium sp.]
MKRKLLLLVFIFSATFSIGQELWNKTNENLISALGKMDRSSIPSKYDLYTLNFVKFKSQLQNVPLDISGQYSNKIVAFPNTNGEMEQYRIYNAPVMEDGLALKHPEIQSFSGININKPSESIRFSTTLFGLHAMVFSNEGTYYIDTYTKDLNNYILYEKKDVVNTRNFTCEVGNDESVKRVMDTNASPISARASDGNFRTYRLAMACTIEYAAFHVNAAGLNAGTLAQKKAAVLAAMVVTMVRVNGVFEKDMSLRMSLVANNDLVIFIDADTFDNANSGTLINQSQTVIDTNIGSANYDIGHTVSTGGGGLAQLFSPCSGSKARGITGQGSPVGDPFDIDYVAHEMGHQWGANHTQNNGCNRNSGTAVEPGSASTIMGYAGICAPNVQSNSDDHFHGVSISEMMNFIAGSGGSCAVTIPNGNSAPIVNAGIDYTIPKGTAFVLKGNATDANNDALTYCWEQTNTEVSTQPPTQTATVGPNFRSNIPSISPNRYMPTLSSVIAGNLAPTWEVVPTVARTMNFSLTVRDNRTPNGGQTGRDNMVVTVANVGPFLVLSPNTAVSYVAGSNQTITWDVAGTTANGVNCSNVDIYLSTNGGTSFPTLLASNVPNDGSETVTIPNAIGTTNRIMISGNKHLFYDVSNANFSITAPTSDFALAFSGIENGQNKEVCQGTDASYDLNYSTLAGFSGTTTFSISGNPAGTIATFLPSSTNATSTVGLTISNTASSLTGLYEMTVTGTSGATTKIVKLYLNILNSTFATMALTSPANLAYAQATNVILNWGADASASSYIVQVATDEDFTTIINNQTVATNSFNLSGLNQLTNYFWRVQPRNSGCFGSFSAPFRFTTGQQTCLNTSSTNVPLAISASGTPTVNSTLTIPAGSNVTISDINVTAQITHSWAEDITLTLISPSGTQVQLVAGQCSNNDNLNTTFDDSGTVLACGTNPAIVGTILPSQPLSALNGQSSQGVWTLRVFDTAAGDGGSLTAWSLNICSVPNTPITCGQITTTWNGTSWTNGRPVNNVAATINGDLTLSGDLDVCSLDIIGTSQVVLQSNSNLTVDGIINVAPAANLTIENNANLIQNQNVVNVANAIVKRNSNPLMRLDYTIWSSPVTGTQTLKSFSPNTLTNRFYNYNTSTNFYELVANPLTQTFNLGKGYLIRMPDNHPTTPTIWNGEFAGNLNNGTIDINLSYVSASQNYNMIGNPYPSTISAENLISNNTSTISGAIYFWRKINNASGTAYASYTQGGATTTSPTSPIPNGIIQVGQGFFVRAKNVATPKVTFTNALRTTNNDNQFFRTNSDTEKNRIWLNLTNDSGLFVQMLAGYMTGATYGFDDSYDAISMNDAPIGLTSLVANEEYSIQLKALPFDVNDVVPLNFKTDAAGNYSIAIDHVDGLFETTNQEVYLRDNMLQVVHNLSNAPYTFSSEIGNFASRFEIAYQNTLATTTPTLENNLVTIATANSQIEIKSLTEKLSKVFIYDLLGRSLYFYEKVDKNELQISTITAHHQALLVKIELQNGQTVIKKIVF